MDFFGAITMPLAIFGFVLALGANARVSKLGKQIKELTAEKNSPPAH